MSDQEPEDEKQFIQLDEAQIQEILQWAVHASSIVTVLLHHDDATNVDETVEKLSAWEQAVEAMMMTMPEVLVEPAHTIAHGMINQHLFTEAAVAELMDELKDL